MSLTDHPPYQIMPKSSAVIACLFLTAAAATLCACTEQPVPRAIPGASPAFQPSASIQDLMASIVEPSAEILWNAVSSEVTAKGVEEKQPQTPEEWQVLRHHAIALQEAGNLLRIRGRAVALPGKVLEDSGVEGVSTPQQIASTIDHNRAAYDAAAGRLHDSATEALAAIDRRDVQQFLLAGERIDAACEHCHSVFWYPNAKTPDAKWPARITTAAPK